MAAKQFTYFFIVLFINQTKTYSINFNMPEIDDEKDFNMRSHLKYHSVWEYCNNRDEACKSNNSNICAVRVWKNRRFYKDFINGCHLFLNNMCDHPEEEYFIVTSGSCEEYLASRRSNDDSEPDTTVDDVESNNKSAESSPDANRTDDIMYGNGSDAALRQHFSSLYDIDTSYDYHICPHSCPNVYAPVCVNVNRGFGKYFKMLTFVNHCASDVYYCKNWKEFTPPPNEDESVRSSPLAWSFCGASRYLQFARFSEVTSSMGYYGWLAGDYKYSHIMEPHQRIPGYG